MRRAARRDSNELLLVHSARALGATMIYMGPLDWWCGHRGKWIPVEVKAKNGHYTPFQKNFLAKCKADSLPVWVWRSIEDVNKCLNQAAEQSLGKWIADKIRSPLE